MTSVIRGVNGPRLGLSKRALRDPTRTSEIIFNDAGNLAPKFASLVHFTLKIDLSAQQFNNLLGDGQGQPSPLLEAWRLIH